MKIPGVKEEKKCDRKLREDIDMIVDKNEYSYENHIITGTGIQREANDHIESMSSKCHAKFNSRNESFKHVEEKNHMAISEGDGDDHINISANQMGQSKNSTAATAISSSCRSTSRRTSKRSAALVIG